jgi:hypothetical protein
VLDRANNVLVTEPGVGLAFNNFSPDVAAPEPSTFVLLVIGLLLPLWRLLRRRS